MTARSAPTGRRCSGCGRPLRDPASVAAGLGPRCRRRSLEGALPLPLPSPTLRTPPLVSTRPARARHLRARITTLPDIATYQETH